MKKHLVFFGVALTMLCTTASAQLELGFSTGLNLNCMQRIYSSQSGTYQAGYRAGLPVRWKINDHLKLKSGFFFNKKESQINNFEFGAEIITRHYRLYSWEIDWQIEYYVTLKNWELSVYAGGTTAYNISARYFDGQWTYKGLDFQPISFREQSLDAVGGITFLRNISTVTKIGADLTIPKMGIVPAGRSGRSIFHGYGINLILSISVM